MIYSAFANGVAGSSYPTTQSINHHRGREEGGTDRVSNDQDTVAQALTFESWQRFD